MKGKKMRRFGRTVGEAEKNGVSRKKKEKVSYCEGESSEKKSKWLIVFFISSNIVFYHKEEDPI